MTGDVTPLFTQAQTSTSTSCVNVVSACVSSIGSVTQSTIDTCQSQLPSQNPASTVIQTGSALSGALDPVAMGTNPRMVSMQGQFYSGTPYQTAKSAGLPPVSGFQPYFHPSFYYQNPWSFQTQFPLGQQYLPPQLPQGGYVPQQQPFLQASAQYQTVSVQGAAKSTRTQP